MSDELISREEVLAGLPARRANTLLFLIESQTVHIAARSRVEFSFTKSAANERDLAFLEAFALGNAPPLHPKIQHLERYALQWKSLVPENPRLKAALVHAMSRKYKFTSAIVPHIREALGLDDKAVQHAYYQQYHKPLDSVFSPGLSWSEQLHWIASCVARRMESLPPFWISSLLTVALGLPQAFLALPIACAALGPLATLVCLITLGGINTLTMVCMAEAIGRSSDFRYGNGFIKQLAANYLGNAGSFILSFAVGVRVFLIALACYIGLSITMANFTYIPAPVWAGLLFFVGLYLLSRKSLNFTVTVMLLLAAVNISLLLLLMLFAFRHVQLENLLYVNLPFFNERSFDPQTLQQVFGVLLMLYFGHIYVGECAKVVLPKDKSAASLIWGSVAGTAFLTFLFCLWVVAINGAIAPQVLAVQSGTVLEPLAELTGPVVKVLGAVLVILLLGMAWIRSSSLLVNIAREWIPSKPRPILVLPCQQGRLIFQPSGNSTRFPLVGLTYLGLSDRHPKFRLDIQLDGELHRLDITVNERWNIKELVSQFKDLNKISLVLDIQSAERESVCLRITTSMGVTYEGILGTTNTNNYSPQRKSKSWQPWVSLLEQPRFLLTLSPLLVVFLITETLFFAGVQSFTSVLSFAGVLGNSLVGGIFPILILIASRRKGEIIPNVAFQFLNQPLLLIGIYSFFLATLLIHGLFIWENTIARTSAVCIAILSLATTLVMHFTGAFASRTVVEIREEQQQEGKTILNISTSGKPKTVDVCVAYTEGEQYHQAAKVEIISPSLLRYITFQQLVSKRVEELRVWAYKSNSSGSLESLPVILEIHEGGRKMQYDLKLFNGQILLPAITNRCFLKIFQAKSIFSNF